MKSHIFDLHKVNTSTKDTELEIFFWLLFCQPIHYSLQADDWNFK